MPRRPASASRKSSADARSSFPPLLGLAQFLRQRRHMSAQRRARYAVRNGLGDQFLQAQPESVLLRRDGPRFLAIEHDRPAPAPQVEPAFVREQAIGFCDRVVVHAQVGGDLPNRRQLLARNELTRYQQRAHPADNLLVDGPRQSQIDSQHAGVRHCLLYTYNIQACILYVYNRQWRTPACCESIWLWRGPSTSRLSAGCA